VLGLDVNASEKTYVTERIGVYDEPPPAVLGQVPRRAPGPGLPDGRAYGIRLALSEVKGISEGEVDRIVAARPYQSLTDFWQRAQVSRPVLERLVLAGGFDSVYGLGSAVAGFGVRRRGKVTRRDLLLQVADLDRHSRAVDRASKGRGRGLAARGAPPGGRVAAVARAENAARGNSSDDLVRDQSRADRQQGGRPDRPWGQPTEQPWDQPSQLHPSRQQAGVWEQAAQQSQATRKAAPVTSIQLALDLGDAPVDGEVSGLPEMNDSERVRAELEILGLDASRHVVEFYDPFLDAINVTRSADLLRRRSTSELLVAGVKVATQTPPIRSGRRVVFLTLDDSTGPVDATFFEDVQGPYAATVFHSWLLVVRGELRRTGRRGVSLRATGCWELPTLHEAWRAGGLDAVHEVMETVPAGFGGDVGEGAVQGAAESRSSRPVIARPTTGNAPSTHPDGAGGDTGAGAGSSAGSSAGGMGRRRVLVHSSGFVMSPYADIKPPGEDAKTAPRRAGSDTPSGAPRKLWHSSSGSSGG
jgi:error-prone DNA polymerase